LRLKVPASSITTVAARVNGIGEDAFHGAPVALEPGDEEDAVRVGECVGVDGVLEFCWKRVERKYFQLGKRLARGSVGGGFGLLQKSLEWSLPPTDVRR
jgi:hypothetical protein